MLSPLWYLGHWVQPDQRGDASLGALLGRLLHLLVTATRVRVYVRLCMRMSECV